MDKREFLEMLIEQVRNLPIENILSRRIDLVKKGSNYKALCPFHNDRHLGSFVISPHKNIFKCFSCSVGGDGIKFISLYDNISYVEAAFRIGLEFGIISYYEYDEYFSRKRYSKKELEKIEKIYIDKLKEKTKEEVKADVNTLNKVYTIFTNLCSLSDEHRKHLLEERKLHEDRLNEFFTFPTRRIMNKLENELQKEGLSLDILKHVPGFYFNKEKNKFSFVTYKGLGIKIKNSNGKIIGLQIRKDEVKDKENRYIWFSSGFMNYKDDCEFGASSGSPIDVVYPKEIKHPIIAITEGRFKAEKLAEIGFITVSLQGITNWQNVIKEIQEIMKKKEYARVYNLYVNKYKTLPSIYICFDTDIVKNENVFIQAKKMSDKIKETLLQFSEIYYIHWDINKGKGFDDLVNNNIDYKREIKKYKKVEFEKMVEKNFFKEKEKNKEKELDFAL